MFYLFLSFKINIFWNICINSFNPPFLTGVSFNFQDIFSIPINTKTCNTLERVYCYFTMGCFCLGGLCPASIWLLFNDKSLFKSIIFKTKTNRMKVFISSYCRYVRNMNKTRNHHACDFYRVVHPLTHTLF